VQNEGTVDGTHYGVAVGINTYALLFDRTLMQKAGLSQDWNPKNWNEILEAARAIKKVSPDSWPIFLITGTAQGASSVTNGPALLLAASSEPTIYDAKTHKWVVDSKGIREVLDFYKRASADGLLAPSSQIMDPNATNNSATVLTNRKTGIVFAGNWIPIDWNKAVCAPCWPTEQQKTIGFARVPMSHGQTPSTAATLDSQTLSIYKNTARPDLAWSAVDIMLQKQNQLDLSTWGPAIPPTPALAKDPVYLNLSQPQFQTSFAELTSNAMSMPSRPEFPVWAYAIQKATEAMVLHPETSIDDGVKVMRKLMVDQVGADNVESLP
jgi:multiple sugar transport system substrate-binding protein